MQPKKGGLKNKFNLNIECEDNLASSVYSEIGPDGLRFIKDDIKVSKEGLTRVSGESSFPPMKFSQLKLGNQLDKGLSSRVYEGIYYLDPQKESQVKVAIKVINVYDREKRHQLMNDIKILLENKINAQNSQIYCPFFVDLYGAFYDQGEVKVVLELMDVGSLNGLLKMFQLANLTTEPMIDEVILAKITQQILNGLIYLHNIGKQVHRDIKPANILLNSKGEVKLTDFGIMKQLDETNQYCHTQLGTKAYMSPERILGKQYNSKSDIWSLGLTISELATGKYPYQKKFTSFIELTQHVINEPVPELSKNSVYSPELQDFINKCLQKEPGKRASAIQLLAHPWILKNVAQDYEIVDWLDNLNKQIIPAAIQQQQQKTQSKISHIQEQINQFQQQQQPQKQLPQVTILEPSSEQLMPDEEKDQFENVQVIENLQEQ